MYFHQYFLDCLAHASYLIGDEESGQAIVVDPQRDVDRYIEDAEKEGLQICGTFLTHFHADFVAGHLELRDRAGATVYLGARAEAEYAHTAMKDGESLELGKLRLVVLETPGHTPEGISILVYDLAKDAVRPHAVLTGDTLFIGDVGRPDLMASVGVSAEELASMLYDSIHDKLLPLPDETLVYPAHGAGSLCGRNLSTDTFSTMGTQRLYNYALQPMAKEKFVALVTVDQPEAPSYFAYDAMLNRREFGTLDDTLERALNALSLDDFMRLRDEGAQALDVRDPADYGGAHLRDSFNISLGGSFATWAGTVLDRERDIIIIADPGGEQEAAVRLGRIGLERITGYLDGGMAALGSRSDLIERTDRVTAGNLAETLESTSPPVVLDVRAESEWRDGHIRDSVNIPLPYLRERVAEVPRERAVTLHCLSGYRSSVAMSILEQEGFTKVTELVGGIAAWEASRLKTVS